MVCHWRLPSVSWARGMDSVCDYLTNMRWRVLVSPLPRSALNSSVAVGEEPGHG